MVNVENTNPHIETEIPEITAENVIYWSRHSKELVGSVRKKAQILVSLDCIQYIGFDDESGRKHAFISLPINTLEEITLTIGGEERTFRKKPFVKDYNNDTTNYRMHRQNDGRWTCSCHGWSAADRDPSRRKPDGVQCSHLLALFYAFKMKKFSKAQGSDSELERPEHTQLRNLGTPKII